VLISGEGNYIKKILRHLFIMFATQMALYGKRGCAGGGRTNAWATGTNDLRLAIKNEAEKFKFVLFSHIKHLIFALYLHLHVCREVNLKNPNKPDIL